ncbi:MAG: cobalamin-dependent protein [Candidatus Omnitrophica bacterium]|nr:cobalamin-dependent protein [Candidatus Omnitrophota bacterium]
MKKIKVLLLYKSFLPEIHWNCLKAQEKNMGAIPPLNLCYVASMIRDLGHEVKLIDLQVEKFSFHELVSNIKEYQPDLLGFTITTYLFQGVLKWIKEIKKCVKIPVLVGGFHMSLYPLETMSHKEIDYAIIGNAQITLRDFLDNLGNLDRYVQIEGLCYRKGDEICINPVKKEGIIGLNEIFLPARDLLKNDLYGNFICKKKNFTVMLTGVGCPFSCKYCTSLLTKCVMRSAESVVDEIAECFYKYNIREIDFYDQSFTIDKDRIVDICRRIIERKLDVVWTIRTRADLIDEEILRIMKKAGLYRVMYGIESGDQKILDNLNKNEKISKLIEVIKLTHKYKISVFGFFMLGCPGETKSSIKKTFKFALSLPFDEIQVTRFTLFPGTEFYKEYQIKTGNDDYWADYVLDKNNVKKLPLLDTSFTTDEIEHYVKMMYLRFYLRPKIVLRKIIDGSLILNFKKYYKATIDMIFN